MKDALLLPRPDRKPITLSALYRRHTKDLFQSEVKIRDVVLTDTVERRRAITLYLKGYSYNMIGVAEGISHGAVSSRITLAMKRAHKILNGIPRRNAPLREFGIGVPDAFGRLEVVSSYKNRDRARASLCLHADGALLVTKPGGCRKGQVLQAGEWLKVGGPVVCRRPRKDKETEDNARN